MAVYQLICVVKTFAAIWNVVGNTSLRLCRKIDKSQREKKKLKLFRLNRWENSYQRACLGVFFKFLLNEIFNAQFPLRQRTFSGAHSQPESVKIIPVSLLFLSFLLIGTKDAFCLVGGKTVFEQKGNFITRTVVVLMRIIWPVKSTKKLSLSVSVSSIFFPTHFLSIIIIIKVFTSTSITV